MLQPFPYSVYLPCVKYLQVVSTSGIYFKEAQALFVLFGLLQEHVNVMTSYMQPIKLREELLLSYLILQSNSMISVIKCPDICMYFRIPFHIWKQITFELCTESIFIIYAEEYRSNIHNKTISSLFSLYQIFLMLLVWKYGESPQTVFAA